ncbi:MAG TPA: type II toxin-antitoxin system RelE/ParE family toxin [Prolixibacteraceae bacterium]
MNDLKGIAEYISKDSKRYANQLIRRIHVKVGLLRNQPYSGRMVDELGRKDVRQLLEGNYRIIYRKVSINQIEILTIHHSAQRLKPPVIM